MARRSTPSNDIDCNAKEMPSGKPVTYCKICSGGIAALAYACSANSACKGFDIEGSGYCGYLKAASGPGKMVYTEVRLLNLISSRARSRSCGLSLNFEHNVESCVQLGSIIRSASQPN